RLETAVGLVDHVGPAATADHAVVAMAVLERLQAVDDLHRSRSKNRAAPEAFRCRNSGVRPYARTSGESSCEANLAQLALPRQRMGHDRLEIRKSRPPRQGG